jgi:hypothetical protein
MVYLVETAGAESPVTLLLSGLVVTGIMCSGESYIVGIAEEPLESPILRRFLGSAIRLERESKGREQSESKVGGVSFLHLRDAHVLTGFWAIPPDVGTWIRVDLNAVDGFILGRWSGSESSTESETSES